jgi:hypothetical protein
MIQIETSLICNLAGSWNAPDVKEAHRTLAEGRKSVPANWGYCVKSSVNPRRRSGSRKWDTTNYIQKFKNRQQMISREEAVRQGDY